MNLRRHNGTAKASKKAALCQLSYSCTARLQQAICQQQVFYKAALGQLLRSKRHSVARNCQATQLLMCSSSRTGDPCRLSADLVIESSGVLLQQIGQPVTGKHQEPIGRHDLAGWGGLACTLDFRTTQAPEPQKFRDLLTSGAVAIEYAEEGLRQVHHCSVSALPGFGC